MIPCCAWLSSRGTVASKDNEIGLQSPAGSRGIAAKYQNKGIRLWLKP
jgi:hypothetical protein